MVNLVLDPRRQAGHESIYFANFFLIRRYVFLKIAKNDLFMSILDLDVKLFAEFRRWPKICKKLFISNI